MRTFDVNTSECIELTNKLTKLHRSAFTVAVRGALNDAAFETKKQVPKIADRKFTTRQKSFFRAFSTVDKASGFNLNTMRSTVGINSAKGSEVAKGLEKQEFGGVIKGRKLLPLDTARTSKSHNKKVRRANRFENIGRVARITGGTSRRRTRKSNFVASVMVTAKLGASYMLLRKGGRGILYRVSGVRQNMRTKKLRFKADPLYHYRNNRASRVSKTPFMEPAAERAAKQIAVFYEKRAEQQFKRLLR